MTLAKPNESSQGPIFPRVSSVKFIKSKTTPFPTKKEKKEGRQKPSNNEEATKAFSCPVSPRLLHSHNVVNFSFHIMSTLRLATVTIFKGCINFVNIIQDE